MIGARARDEGLLDAAAVEVGAPDGARMVGPVDMGVVDRDPLRAAEGGDEVLLDSRAVEVGPSDRAVEVRPVDVRVVDRHPLGGAGADEARVDPAAVEVGAPDRVGVEVGPVDVAAVDRQSVDLDLGPDADKTRVRGRAVEIGARDRPGVIRPVDEPIGPRGEREGGEREGGEEERGAHQWRATARGRRRRREAGRSPSRIPCVHEGPFSRRPNSPERAFGWWRQPKPDLGPVKDGATRVST